MLKGRLGLESARVPQTDRHGVMWLGYGRIYVDDGTLRFKTAGWDDLPAGDYAIPFQLLTCIVLQPGTSLTHDVLRLCVAHGTGIVAAGTNGVRFFAVAPLHPDSATRARRHATLWADPERRIAVARRMYAWRLGEVFPRADIAVLRGMEGSRMKATYERLAQLYGVEWRGRRYDREHPELTDSVNMAINHASTAIGAAASVAVAITGTIPQLGFVHEDSGDAFALDIADLFRDSVALPVAFNGVRDAQRKPASELERTVRRIAGGTLRREDVIGKMIDRIKELFDGDDRGGDA